jgi:predicted Zn-dependent peptidase
VNVKNQPYGGFSWIDISKLAFDKWENNHDGYGSFEDLEGASLDDVRGFHRDYYGPNNAVLAIAGDVTPAQAFALAQKYFGGIARRPTPKPTDFTEGVGTKEKRIEQSDALAQVPAIAAAWKVPARGSKDQAPMAVLAELLAGGDASLLYQGMVKNREIALNVSYGFGLTGPFEYDGPTLFTVTGLYKPNGNADSMLAAMDDEIAKVAKNGVDSAALKRVKTSMVADWNNGLENILSRADTLAKLQTLWGDANVVNKVPGWIEGVTSADVQRVAATYLVTANRTVIDRKPVAKPAAPAAPQPVNTAVTNPSPAEQKTAPAAAGAKN